MKRIIIVVIAVFLPVCMYAQTWTSPRMMTQTQYNNLLVPVPIDPLDDYFVNYGPSTETTSILEGIDYVTRGSLMPYRVDKPLSTTEMPGNNFSIQYMWLFTPQAPLTPVTKLSVLKMPEAAAELPTPAAATTPTVAPETDFFMNNEVSVRIPENVTAGQSFPGDVILQHRVRYIFNTTEMCPDGDGPHIKSHRIRVIDRPSIIINTANGTTEAGLETVGCIGQDVELPTTGATAQLLVTSGVTERQDIAVQFSLKHFALGTGAETPIASEQWLMLEGLKLEFPGELFAAAGVYEIEFHNVTDRISRKSLDQNAIKALADVNMPTGGKYKVYILPSITSPDDMEPVQHIRNVPIP